MSKIIKIRSYLARIHCSKKYASKIKHKKLGREVSYEYLMRLEVYKLIKQFLEDEKYEGFKMWW